MGNLEKYSEKQAQLCIKYGEVDSELYNIYGVKRGLRDINGQGVVVGFTNISKITAFKTENGEKIPCDGELLYRGYDIQDLIIGNLERKNIYEEGAYLLLFGELPNEEQLVEFKKMIADNMTLPTNFTSVIQLKNWQEE